MGITLSQAFGFEPGAALREAEAETRMERMATKRWGKRNVRSKGHLKVRASLDGADELRQIVESVAQEVMPNDVLWPKVESRPDPDGYRYIHTVYWSVHKPGDARVGGGLFESPCRRLVNWVEDHRDELTDYDPSEIRAAYWDAEPELQDLCALELMSLSGRRRKER